MTAQDSLNLVRQLIATGDLDDAERHCRDLVEAGEATAPVYLNLARIAYQRRSYDEADAHLRNAAGLDPADAGIPAQRCEVLRCLGRSEDAEAAARAALALDNDSVEANYNLAVLCAELGRPDEAVHLLETVLERQPDHEAALLNLGVLRDRAGDLDGAAQSYRGALRANPASLSARRNLASLLFDQGDHDEARALYASIIRQVPDDVDAHFAYSRLTRYAPDDPTMAALERIGGRLAALPLPERVKLCFTIGKASEDLGDYAQAFDAFATGNDLHYARHPYNERAHHAMLDDVVRCLDHEFMERRSDVVDAASAPIFVLGMPRSGSTLVEQILATHSEVAAAGEVGYLKAAIQRHLIGDRQTFSNALPHWTESSLAAAAADYLHNLKRHAAGRARVIDKMPGNFAFIGLIARLFPDAKIIHTVRHPMANLWSNYSTHFGDALYYTYRLDVLARYIGKYSEVMQHWRDVLPAGRVYDLEYEALLRDPESTLEPLFDYLGLDWQPACLDFHQSQRLVRTASVAQVRKPLYTSAVDTWRNYRERLRPFEEALGAG